MRLRARIEVCIASVVFWRSRREERGVLVYNVDPGLELFSCVKKRRSDESVWFTELSGLMCVSVSEC